MSASSDMPVTRVEVSVNPNEFATDCTHCAIKMRDDSKILLSEAASKWVKWMFNTPLADNPDVKFTVTDVCEHKRYFTLILTRRR
jgi:hypothetical protein